MLPHTASEVSAAGLSEPAWGQQGIHHEKEATVGPFSQSLSFRQYLCACKGSRTVLLSDTVACISAVAK